MQHLYLIRDIAVNVKGKFWYFLEIQRSTIIRVNFFFKKRFFKDQKKSVYNVKAHGKHNY